MGKRKISLIHVAIIGFTILYNTQIAVAADEPYLGKFLGKLTELEHKVSGEVYAVDARTLHIKDLTYDGEGPAAYFFAGNSKVPSNSGFRIPDEHGSLDILKPYHKKSVTITLPEGKTLANAKWFSLWCEEFSVNFGDVTIPQGLKFPKPQKISPLKGVHDISSDNIVIVDAQTLLIPNLSFDGEAPDAKFWVGQGPKPSPQGIQVPDENGKRKPLRRYDRKTVVLTLPQNLTIFDLGHFGIWCEAFTVDFGHIQIPQNLNVPPSLKMLGVSPQSKLNCEVLNDDNAFEVRWAIAGDSIVIQLVSKLGDGEYMSFGLSGEDNHSTMIDGDVVVAWVDKETTKGYAVDYFLEAKSQCTGKGGSCPDEKLMNNTNNIKLLNAAIVNGYSIVTYQRSLRANDKLDRRIVTNKPQAIIWAIGPLNQRREVSFHNLYLKNDQFLHFGRQPHWNCPMPETDRPQVQMQSSLRGGNKFKDLGYLENSEKPSSNERRRPQKVPTPKPVQNGADKWKIPPIQCNEPEDGVFYAQMGPTGGKKGYSAITGHVGWGISWYINGLLIPEINVVRGKTYTFVVEGGHDPEIAAKYHPFYITDDPIGGFEYKTKEEKANVRIYAGATQTNTGEVIPIGTGRLCHWTPKENISPEEFDSFGAYQRVLELVCDAGEPGIITWTPDENTPDTVYYQCFTHRYLGWKINVLDSCESQYSQSEKVESRVRSPGKLIPTENSLSGRTNSNTTNPLLTDYIPTTVTPFDNIFIKMLANNKNNIALTPTKAYSDNDFKPIPTSTSNDFLINIIENNKYENLDTTSGYKYNDSAAVPSQITNNVVTSPTLETIYVNMVEHNNDHFITNTYHEPSINHYMSTNSFIPSPLDVVNGLTTEQYNINNDYMDSFKSDAVPDIITAPQITTPPSETTTEMYREDTKTVYVQEEPQVHEDVQDIPPVKFISQIPHNTIHESPLTAAALQAPMLMPNTNSMITKQVPNINMNHIMLYKKPVSMFKPESLDYNFDHMNHRHRFMPHHLMKSPVQRFTLYKRPVAMSSMIRPIYHQPPKMYFMNSRSFYMKHPMIKPMPRFLPYNMVVKNSKKYHPNNYPQSIAEMFTSMHKPMHLEPLVEYRNYSVAKPLNYITSESINITNKDNGSSIVQKVNQTVPDSDLFLQAESNLPKNYRNVRPVTEEILEFNFNNSTEKKNQMSPTKILTVAPDSRETFKVSSSTDFFTSKENNFISSEKKTFEIHPSKMLSMHPDSRDIFKLTPARNTGFHPDSVIVEGGFKPITSKPIPVAQDRMSNIDIEPIYDDEIGVIDLTQDNNNNDDDNRVNYSQQIETFEPMFIPSPPDRITGKFRENKESLNKQILTKIPDNHLKFDENDLIHTLIIKSLT